MSEHIPATRAEIARASFDADNAGASIIHLRACYPDADKPVPRPESLQRFLPNVKQSTDAFTKVSTGGKPGATMDKRFGAAMSVSPEMASLNMGAENFGIFPLLEGIGESTFDWTSEFPASAEEIPFPVTFATGEHAVRHPGHAHDAECEFEC